MDIIDLDKDLPPLKQFKLSKKAKFSLALVVLAVISASALYSLYRISQFFDSNRIIWQSVIVISNSSITLRTPLYIEKRVIKLNLAPPFALTAHAQELKETIEFISSPHTDIEKLIISTFGSYSQDAIKIAKCESGLNPEMIGDLNLVYRLNGKQYGMSYGIFQIRYLPDRPVPSELLDPAVNIQTAHAIFTASGSKFASAWVRCSKQLNIK